MPICRDMIKTRKLQFIQQLPGSDQAAKASALLSKVHGIEFVEQTKMGRLRIRYDVRELTLQMIVRALKDVNFVLDNSFTTRIIHSLYAYCEDAQRASIGVENHADHPVLSHPDTATHDPRPHNWRNYI